MFANPIGIWRHPEKSVDVQLTYNINDRMALDISGVNLTNEMQQQYYHFGDAGDAQTTNFGTVQVGRSFSARFSPEDLNGAGVNLMSKGVKRARPS